ncbi:MAG TPA: hypothetical protein VL133_13700 [Devosia sp.]|nr:hypothetical protein [Devosia sp.]
MQTNTVVAPMPSRTTKPRGDNRKLFKRDRSTARRLADQAKRAWLNQ